MSQDSEGLDGPRNNRVVTDSEHSGEESVLESENDTETSQEQSIDEISETSSKESVVESESDDETSEDESIADFESIDEDPPFNAKLRAIVHESVIAAEAEFKLHFHDYLKSKDRPERFDEESIQRNIKVLCNQLNEQNITKYHRQAIMKELKDKQWWLDNWHDTAVREFWLDSLGSPRKARRIDKEFWEVEHWVGTDQFKTTTVDAQAMREFLTIEAFESATFRQKKLVWIPKFFLKQDVYLVTFGHVRLTMDGKWIGKDKDGDTVTLPEDWIKDRGHIHEDNYNEVIRACTNNPGQFVKVIPGCRSGTLNNLDTNKRFPENKYMSSQFDHACIPCSFASAIHAAGYQESAELLIDLCRGLTKDTTFMGKFHVAVQSVFKKRFEFRLLKKYYDPLQKKHRKPYPILAHMVGRDNKVNHCVTFMGHLVFDATAQRAMPITKESLSAICGSSGYERVTKPRALLPKE